MQNCNLIILEASWNKIKTTCPKAVYVSTCIFNSIVLLCAVQYRGYPVGYFVLMLRPPFSSAVAAHRSHTACFHFAREVGQNQRNTSVFKAFWPCSYYNLIVDSTNYSCCFHIYKSPYFRNCGTIICKTAAFMQQKRFVLTALWF